MNLQPWFKAFLFGERRCIREHLMHQSYVIRLQGGISDICVIQTALIYHLSLCMSALKHIYVYARVKYNMMITYTWMIII